MSPPAGKGNSLNAAIAHVRIFLRNPRALPTPRVQAAIRLLMRHGASDESVARFVSNLQNGAQGSREIDEAFADFRAQWQFTTDIGPEMRIASPSVRYVLSLPGTWTTGTEILDPVAVPVGEDGAGAAATVTLVPMAFVVRKDGGYLTYMRTSRSGSGLYTLTPQTATAGSATTFSSAGVNAISGSSMDVNAVLYVNEANVTEYEQHMGTLSTLKIKNVVDPLETSSALPGVLTLLVNSPEAASIVPPEPSAWETKALQEESQQDQPKELTPRRRSAWLTALLFVLVGGLVGVIALLISWKLKGSGSSISGTTSGARNRY